MPVPSLYLSRDGARVWNVARAASYGAGIGAFAAVCKTLGPLHQAGSAAAIILQIAGAALAFALLCTAAAAMRNFIARWFIWQE
jgi:hypothetical protein